MMKPIHPLSALLLLSSSPLWANSPEAQEQIQRQKTQQLQNLQQQIEARRDEQRLQNTVPHTPTVNLQQTNKPKQNPKDAETISMTKEELVNHPELVVRALLPAVLNNNSEHIELLYPIYQKIPSQYHDPILTEWAQAILSQKAQRYSQAISHYRQVIAKESGLLQARFQLAVALFENHELEAAEDQFQKLRSEKLPGDAIELIDQFLLAVSRQNRWSFSGGLTYLYDPNINNAPKSGTTYNNWKASERESAHGLGLNFELGKKWAWGDSFYNQLRANTQTKYYWNNKKYNEASLRGSLGIGFKNAQYKLALLPFMEQSLYAGGSAQSESLKRFSKSSGGALETSYDLSPQWQLSGYYEYAENRYTSRKHLNGNSHYGSLGITYLPSASQYWFSQANYSRTSTRDKDDSFYRKGIQLGWGQEWGNGLSTRLSASFGIKHYKGPMPIFGIVQRNKEYGAQASVWHRAVHFWGLTPRLTYQYNKTQSNHPFYTYDKHRSFIELSKTF